MIDAGTRDITESAFKALAIMRVYIVEVGMVNVAGGFQYSAYNLVASSVKQAIEQVLPIAKVQHGQLGWKSFYAKSVYIDASVPEISRCRI